MMVTFSGTWPVAAVGVLRSPSHADTDGRQQHAGRDRAGECGTASTIGPDTAAAAQAALDRVRQNINTTTAPTYAAAEPQTQSAADYAPMHNSPAYQVSLARLRSDPGLGPQFSDMPDNAVGTIDAVSKDMAAQGQTLGNVAHPGFSPQKAAIYTAGAAQARETARIAAPTMTPP